MNATSSDVQDELPFNIHKQFKLLVKEISRPREQVDVCTFSDLSHLFQSSYFNALTDYMFESMVKFFVDQSSKEHDQLSLSDQSTPSPAQLLAKTNIFTEYEPLISCLTNICLKWPWFVSLQLNNVMAEKRLRIVAIFKSVFALYSEFNGSVGNFAREIQSKAVWKDYLVCFRDKDNRVRAMCARSVIYLLSTECSENVVTDIQEQLSYRLLDANPQIRLDLLEIMENVSENCVSNICCPTLVKIFASRCGDIDDNVRSKAILCVSNVFTAMLLINNPKIIKVDHVFKMASACLLMYKYINSEEEKVGIERVFERVLVNSLLVDVTQKAENLLNLVCYCTNQALVAIGKLLFNANYMRQQVMDVLWLVEKDEVSFSSEDKRDLKLMLRNLSRFFPQFARPSKLLELVLVTKLRENKELLMQVKQLFGSGRTVKFPEALLIAGEFASGGALNSQSSESGSERSENSKEEQELRELLITRCSPFTIDLQVLDAILTQVELFDIRYERKLGTFIVLLSNLYADYFKRGDIGESVMKLPIGVIKVIASEEVKPLLFLPNTLVFKIQKIVNEHRLNNEIDFMSSGSSTASSGFTSPSPPLSLSSEVPDLGEEADDTQMRRKSATASMSGMQERGSLTSRVGIAYVNRHIIAGLENCFL